MNSTKTVEIPNFVVGERVGLGPDHNNPGIIKQIEGLRAKVRFGHHPKEYRDWYGIDELYALPTVKIGDRVGYKSVNDPNPGTVTEIRHSRAAVRWDKGAFFGERWFHAEELVVLPKSVLAGPPENVWDFPAGVFDVLSALADDPHIICLVRDGQPLPAARPFIHPNRSAAVVEAERLAKKRTRF